MPWRRAKFKDKTVWALVGAGGSAEVTSGRVPIRYSNKAGAKIYQAGASRVQVDEAAPLEQLDAGEAAPALQRGTSKGTGSGRGSGFGKAGTRTQAQAAMAADAARSLISGLEGRAVLCFTDGACKGNPGPAGSGVVILPPGGPQQERSVGLGRATNNVAELTAIQVALQMLDEQAVLQEAEVAIFTDSSYCHGVLVKGWKAKANQALILDIRDRLAARPGVTIYWIAGHVGVQGNERADALANAGVNARA